LDFNVIEENMVLVTDIFERLSTNMTHNFYKLSYYEGNFTIDKNCVI